MPVVDTDFLFALNPRDRKHQHAMKLLDTVSNLIVPDSAVIEFQAVLRVRGRSLSQTKLALLALHGALARRKVREAKTISTSLLAFQAELEEKYGLSFFDSLIAASVLALDREVVSDDEAFDRVPDLRRKPISPH